MDKQAVSQECVFGNGQFEGNWMWTMGAGSGTTQGTGG